MNQILFPFEFPFEITTIREVTDKKNHFMKFSRLVFALCESFKNYYFSVVVEAWLSEDV